VLLQRRVECARLVMEMVVGGPDRRVVVALPGQHRAGALQAQAGIGERCCTNHERRPLHAMREITQTVKVTRHERTVRLVEILPVRRLQCVDQGGRLIAEAVELVCAEARNCA
jgi:hypothetical protein